MFLFFLCFSIPEISEIIYSLKREVRDGHKKFMIFGSFMTFGAYIYATLFINIVNDSE